MQFAMRLKFFIENHELSVRFLCRPNQAQLLQRLKLRGKDALPQSRTSCLTIRRNPNGQIDLA